MTELYAALDWSDLAGKVDMSAVVGKVDISAFAPKVDMSAVIGKVDTSALLGKVDTSALFPKYDISPLFPKFDISALLPKYDTSALFSKLDTSALLPNFATLPVVDISWILRDYVTFSPSLVPPNFDDLLDSLLTRYPANWPDDEELTFDLAKQIVENEGIPIVYIPRAEIVSELVQAADRAERGAILVARTADILEDCADALSYELHTAVEELKELLLDAMHTLGAGHHRSAQSLSVDVCTTLIEAHIGKHNKAKNLCRVTKLNEAFAEDRLRYVLGVAPVVNLMTEWNPKSGKPRPAPLSRHVCAHQAHPSHFTPENAILAVMVATSLIRALDERYSWPAPDTSL